MNRTRRYSPEVRERAVRLVFAQEAEHSSQYLSIRYTERLATAGIERSVGHEHVAPQ